MGAAAHDNRDTYHSNYQSRESRVDGQNTFLGNDRREIVSEAFLELSIPHKPVLFQQLPAEEKYKLKKSQEYRQIDKKIEMSYNGKDADSRYHQKELQQKRRTLTSRALRKWQKEQPYRPNDSLPYHYGIFDRCRFMMPERDRLANNLFKSATLRSPLGISVLRDMTALLKKTSEVEFRPGLEREKYLCPKVKKESQNGTDKTCGIYDWRHIYKCYKQSCCSKYGFAELCFICNEWVFSEQGWGEHCFSHL
jgi:hypothetical protein